MALLKINNVRIKGMAACVPSDIEENSDYPYFDENELDRILPTIGVERRRVLTSSLRHPRSLVGSFKEIKNRLDDLVLVR